MAGGPSIDTRPGFSLDGLGQSTSRTPKKDRTRTSRVATWTRPPAGSTLWGPRAYVGYFEDAASRRRTRSAPDKESYEHVTSKVGSFENISHAPRGGSRSCSRPGSAAGSRRNSQDENTRDMGELLASSFSSPTLNNQPHNSKDKDSDEDVYDPLEVRRRMMRAKSAPNVKYSEEGVVQILSTKLTFKQDAQSKIGSFDNAYHRPGGGNIKILDKKLQYRREARSRTDSGLSKTTPKRGAKLSLDSSTAGYRKTSQTHSTAHRTRSEGSRPVGLPLGLRRFARSPQWDSMSPQRSTDELHSVSATPKRKTGMAQVIPRLEVVDYEGLSETGGSGSGLEVLRESEEDEKCGDETQGP